MQGTRSGSCAVSGRRLGSLRAGVGVGIALLLAPGCGHHARGAEAGDADEAGVVQGQVQAGAAGAPGEDGAQPQQAATTVQAPAPAAAGAGDQPAPKLDACDARVVSASRPCSDDPDPCGLDSGWEGDEYCLKPPPAGEGIQIHFGPRDYKDSAATAEYVLQPGEQVNNSMLAKVPLDAPRYWHHVTVHMRPSVDRWISMGGPKEPGREGVYTDTGCGDGRLFGAGGFGGGHSPIYDNPPHGVAAPENAGIGVRMTDATACLATTAFNFTDKPRLREAWVNLYFTDAPTHVEKTGAVSLVGELGLNLPAGEKREYTYQAAFSESGRIIQLYGHRRMWTRRLAAWLNDQLIYDSYDWQEGVVFSYDSITSNPPIDPAGMRDGAASGILSFKAGDTIKYTCFVDNQSGGPLRFKNDLRGSEMCNLGGTTVGGSASGTFQ